MSEQKPKPFEEISVIPELKKLKKSAFKKYCTIFLVAYLVITSFFTALYFGNQRLKIEIGSFTLVK